LNSKEVAQLIGSILISKKATDVEILDLRGVTDLVEYFVICTALSETHSKALLEAVRENLSPFKVIPWHIEGESFAHWILIDYVDIVVHIFLPETRSYYSLEMLWGDVPHIEIPEQIEVETTPSTKAGDKKSKKSNPEPQS
jgi:ribosome-associated protein